MAKLLTVTTTLLLLLDTTRAANLDIYGPQTAFTSRYWDCCKPSCAWADKAVFNNNNPVQACDVNNQPLADDQAGTGCSGGNSYSCANQSPWAVNETFSYGFVGAFLLGGSERNWCCSCYELEFLDGVVKGQKMIVQASNTDYEMPDQNIFTFGVCSSILSRFTLQNKKRKKQEEGTRFQLSHMVELADECSNCTDTSWKHLLRQRLRHAI